MRRNGAVLGFAMVPATILSAGRHPNEKEGAGRVAGPQGRVAFGDGRFASYPSGEHRGVGVRALMA